MALIWFDGFESYNGVTDYIAALVGSGVFSGVIDYGYNTWGAYGRRSSRGFRTERYSNPLAHTFSSNHVTLIVGFSMYGAATTVPTYNSTGSFLNILDGATRQISFHLVGTEIHVYNGDGSKLGETSGFGYSYLGTTYFETKFTINGSTGVVEIKSNGDEVLALSEENTQYSANAYANGFSISAGYPGFVILHLDDLYVCDDIGDAPHNDFLGDIRIDAQRPDAVGNYSQFTPSAGDNFENVDETYGPDDDSTYNDGSTVGHQDSYGLPALPAPAGTTIYGVKDQITVKKTDAGSRKCKILTRQGGSDYLGDEITLSDTYLTRSRIMEDNPDDAAAFEDADISGGEIGVEITV